MLIAIQVLLALHVGLWLWAGGETLSPVEPSESMETLKHGIINVGALLFGTALLSTAILGRWFCGWGCHVILLQDWCERLLVRWGIRPKPFRSRLLLWVPLALALYMFAWPVVYRLALAPFVQPDLHWPGWSWQLTTNDFWKTFPSWAVAIPFLFVCGFVTVYLLGGKAYCTYGCPYGGFFAPLDRLARGRIRVNDDCEGCGHCTASCSSNVRVHEEVRDFKMVVDPGCMKCLDCVAACPKEALRFDFGPAPDSSQRPAAGRLFDLRLWEELVIAIVGVGTMLAVRGAYGAVPLLFASGIGACVAFVAWKATRVIHGGSAAFHGHQLRRNGKPTALGLAWVVGAALALAAVAHTGWISVLAERGNAAYVSLDLPESDVFGDHRVELEPTRRDAAQRGLEDLTAASNFRSGGWGVGSQSWQDGLDLRRAWIHCVLHDYAAAQSLLQAMYDRSPTEAVAANIGRIMRAQGDDLGAERSYQDAITAHPDWGRLRDERILWLIQSSRYDEALAAARHWVADRPDDLMGMRRLSLVLLDSPQPELVEEGIALVRHTLTIDPSNGFAHYALGLAEAQRGRLDLALPAFEEALRLQPEHPAVRQALAQLYSEIGRESEAAKLLAPAQPPR